jgi:hypothetical protein
LVIFSTILLLSAGPATEPTTLQDGGHTFLVQVDQNWKILYSGEGRSRGIVIGLRRHKTDNSPDECFLVQEEGIAPDLDKQAADEAHPAKEDDPKIKPAIEHCVIDGEQGIRIEMITHVNDLPVRKICYVANHDGRSYHIVWDCFDDKAIDAKKDLDTIMKSFEWHKPT